MDKKYKIINELPDGIYILALIFISFVYYFSIVDKILSIYLCDFGRDLYISLRTFRGDLYLRDFEYPYGFIMPYIVSLFYYILGVSIKTFNITWMSMQILVIVFTFMTARFVLSKSYSFICAFSLLLAYYTIPVIQPNHIGGQLFGLISLYLILKYFLFSQRPVFIILSAFFCGLVSANKLNMGLATYFSNIFILILFNNTENNNRFILTKLDFRNITKYSLVFFISGLLPYLVLFSIAGFPKTMRFFSAWFVHGVQPRFFHLKIYFRQFLNQGMSFNLLKNFLMNNLNIFLLISLLVSFILVIKSKSILKKERLAIGAIILFSFFKTHEYILSGTYYSLTLWFFSPAIILLFWCFYKIKNIYNISRVFINSLVIAISLFTIIYCIASYLNINAKCKHYLDLERGKIFTANLNDNKVITDTVNYIKQRTSHNEPIQSLFFVPLFEYLLDTKEVFWESFNGSAKGKILKYFIDDSLRRLKIQKPKYIVVVNNFGYPYLEPNESKDILDYLNLNYRFDKEFLPENPNEDYYQLKKVRLYKLKI